MAQSHAHSVFDGPWFLDQDGDPRSLGGTSGNWVLVRTRLNALSSINSSLGIARFCTGVYQPRHQAVSESVVRGKVVCKFHSTVLASYALLRDPDLERISYLFGGTDFHGTVFAGVVTIDPNRFIEDANNAIRREVGTAPSARRFRVGDKVQLVARDEFSGKVFEIVKAAAGKFVLQLGGFTFSIGAHNIQSAS